ncbi:hypothetical protein HNR46_000942 [Haloferula luteola]|uniref:DUF4397 domain-containing protein n=1 Tax=Haloferula luteola TaxID=595692 RepID=A0A840V504_9BACT|nr:hypothetical protein [Haloferula luteola]MBB5350714.1 hypothetical protein [Haloferula luteola]
MMTVRHLLAAFLLVVSALVAPMQAQSERSIQFRALCLQYQNDVRSGRVPSGKGGSGEVEFFTGGFGELHQGTFKDNTAVFYVEDSSAPDGKRIIASGKLAEGNVQLFLLVPDGEKDRAYRIQCFADDVAHFPMGGVRFLNLTSFPARLELAGTTLKPVNPGTAQVYPMVTKADEWNMYQVRLELQAPTGQWATISSPSWKALKTKRDFVVITIDPKSKRPKIFSFKDLPPWLENPESAGNP